MEQNYLNPEIQGGITEEDAKNMRAISAAMPELDSSEVYNMVQLINAEIDEAEAELGFDGESGGLDVDEMFKMAHVFAGSEYVMHKSKPSRKEPEERVYSHRSRLTLDYLHKFKYLYDKQPAKKEDDSEGVDSRYPKAMPEEFYSLLPSFYRWLPMEQREFPHLRDAVLHSVMAMASGVLAHCYVIHDSERRWCNVMYLFGGDSSAGKHFITAAKKALVPIHKELFKQRKENERMYERRMEAYEHAKKNIASEKNITAEEMELRMLALEEPVMPFSPVLLTAPLNTSARLIDDLDKNGPLTLVMVQPEMELSMKSNKGEHGGHLDVLYLGYDNDTIHKSIKTGGEEQYIEHAALTFVGTMTQEQIPHFYGDFSSGMESRVNAMLLYRCMGYRPESEQTEEHQRVMEAMGNELYDLYFNLRHCDGSDACYILALTAEQKEQMDNFFCIKTAEVEATYSSKNAAAVVFRRVLDFKRWLMQLTLFRLREQRGSWDEALASYTVTPSNEDVDLMLYYTNSVIDQSLYCIEQYGNIQRIEDTRPERLSKQEILLKLDTKFCSSEVKRLMELNGYKPREIFRAIEAWLNAGDIACTGKHGRERNFRKLNTREKRKVLNLSTKKMNQPQKSVKQRGKRK